VRQVAPIIKRKIALTQIKYLLKIRVYHVEWERKFSNRIFMFCTQSLFYGLA